jgi:hypothetical protein
MEFLVYFDCNKVSAMAFLKSELGYKPYLYKHYESVFTRFYRGYILPVKFKVDKCELHLSAFVSGQVRRNEALASWITMIPIPISHAEARRKLFHA